MADDHTTSGLIRLLPADPAARASLARSLRGSALEKAVLALLATDANAGVRYEVAWNAHTPATTLAVLAKDAKAYVRERAAAQLVARAAAGPEHEVA